MIKGIIINPYEESFEYTYLSDELNDKEISIVCNCKRFVKRSFVNTKTFTFRDQLKGYEGVELFNDPILYENAIGFQEHNQRYFKINIGDIPRMCAGICLLIQGNNDKFLNAYEPMTIETVEDLVTWVHPSYIEGNELC